MLYGEDHSSFYRFWQPVANLSRLMLYQGLVLVLFGVTLLIFPELLIYLVALGFIFVGSLFLLLYWQGRSWRQQNNHSRMS